MEAPVACGLSAAGLWSRRGRGSRPAAHALLVTPAAARTYQLTGRRPGPRTRPSIRHEPALSTAVWLLSCISCSALAKPSTVCGRPCGVSYSGAAALRTRRPLHACSGHQGEIRQADSRVPSPAVPPPRGAEAKTIACATGSRNSRHAPLTPLRKTMALSPTQRT
jgi:hypothetical protein